MCDNSKALLDGCIGSELKNVGLNSNWKSFDKIEQGQEKIEDISTGSNNRIRQFILS
jgi:hypothetical protein